MKITARQLLTINLVLITLNVLGVGYIYFKANARTYGEVSLRQSYLFPDRDKPDRLRMIFDRNIILEKDLGRVEKRALLNFQPACPGKLVWAEPDMLEYIFDKPIPLGRVFTVSLTDQFDHRTGMKITNGRSFEVRTSPFELRSFHAIAADAVHITVELVFNLPVDPSDLMRNVIFQDGASVKTPRISEIQCLTKAPSDKITLQVPRPSTNNLKLTISGRLKSPEADITLSDTVSRVLSIDPGFAFLHAEVDLPYLSETASLHLHFSQPLNRKQDLPEIGITPSVEEIKTYRSNNVLVVTGKFLPEKRYTLRLPSILCSEQDKTLGKEVSVVAEIPKRDPAISIQHRQGILSPYGNRQIELKAVNISDIKLSAWRVYENNLAAFLHGHGQYETSRELPQKTIPCDLVRNTIQNFAIELKDLVQPGPGMYSIRAHSSNNYWAQDHILVSLTDIGITSKSDKDGCLVWITSLRHGKPMDGVTVKAITFNNQTLATGVTDPNGIIRLEYSAQGKDGRMWVITAQKEDDLAYLLPEDNRWVIDDIDTDGHPYPEDIEAMVYSERGVYRPGDSVHLTGILRRSNGTIPPVFPVRLLVTRPDGRRVEDRMIERKEDRQGFFHADFPTRDDMQTGMYSFDITLPGSHTIIGSTTAFIETFLPQRIKVEAKTTAERYSPTETPMVKVVGTYLWDAPAAELPLRIEPRLVPIRPQPEAFKGYQFGKSITTGPVQIPTVKQILDTSGNAEVNIEIPKDVPAGFYRMFFGATVTEPGSRSVSDNGSAIVDRLGKHIGLKTREGTLVSPGVACRADWVCLQTNETEIAPGPLQVQLMAVKYDSFLTQVNRRNIWKSEEKLQTIKTETIESTGASRGSISFTCADAGRYRLVVIDTVSKSETWLEVYSSENGAEQSLAMNQPEKLEIVIDQPKYLPGSTVKALVRSPLSGTLFAALETDRVVSYQIVEMKNNSAEISIPLPKELRGGAYLTAAVVRSVDPKQPKWLPHRAMGMQRIRLDHEKEKMPIRILAPDSIRPREEIVVDVVTDAAIDPNHPGMVHVWAVDEGILLPTDYLTPDPFGFFLSPRQPGVGTSDVFLDLLPDYERPACFARIGADGPRRTVGGLRRSPVRTERKEPDVVWREVISLDRDGRGKVTMKTPNLIGQIRVMAVAADQDRYGKADKPVVMTSPLFIETGWPRFAAPGDRFEVPVKLFNSTGNEIKVRLDIAHTKQIKIENPSAQLTVLSGKPHSYLLNVQAREIGAAKIEIKATAIESTSQPLAAEASISLPVRPATALHSEVHTWSMAAGTELTLEPSRAFIPGTEQRKLSISAMPIVELEPVLERLIDYPYGCLEQTTSRLFALIYASKILDSSRADRIGDMVTAGIVRLWSMQTVSGGLSFWPGGTQPSLWGSAYAGWCLLEARKAGYEIEKAFLEALLKYLDSQLNQPDTESPAATRALICHVLSGFDQPKLGWMNGLAERRDKLDPAGLAHLAAAFHTQGSTGKAKSFLAGEPINSAAGSTMRGHLTSHLQQTATWLSVLLDIDPQDSRIVPMVKQMMDARFNGCWGSTLENSAALMALTRYQSMNRRDPSDFAGALRLADGAEFSFTHEKPLTQKFENVAGPMKIASSGRGTMYISSISEGLATSEQLVPYAKNLEVTRRWLDRTGKVIDANDLKVGDLVQVEVSIRTMLPQPVDHIVIVDALPGGMEVENPRLASSQQGEGYVVRADHVEFLDDRVVIFCGVNRESQIHRYSLRVVTAGQFDKPPIQASSMYDPAIAAMGPIGKVTVKP